jgi:putative N6-adenine-specific DNA methylase
VVCNPPFGRRLGDVRALGQLYASLGRLLAGPLARWHAGVLVADRRLESAFGRKPVARHTVMSGGLRIHLLRFEPLAGR